MRFVFDTNIFVLYFLGDPAESIIKAALAPPESRPLSFYYAEATLEEYEIVLSELRLENPRVFTPKRTTALLALIAQHGQRVHPTTTLHACSHEPDNRFLECAVAAEADYLVTVNLRHFPASYQGIEIIPPHRCYQLLFE